MLGWIASDDELAGRAINDVDPETTAQVSAVIAEDKLRELLREATEKRVAREILTPAGLLGAAFFVADPITTPREQGPTTGRWHAVFGALFVLGFPVVAALLAVYTIATGSPLWPWSLGMGLLVWACLAVFMVLVVRWRRQGRPVGPEMPIGLPNRLFAAAYVVWTIVIALAAWPLLG